MEKSAPTAYELPAPVPAPPPKKNGLRVISYTILPFLVFLAFLRHPLWSSIPGKTYDYDIASSQCKQQDPLHPSKGSDRVEHMYEYLSSDDFKESSIARLANAVQIPTESFDDLGKIGEDPRWDIMYKFAEYLKITFPLVHEHMEPEVVNTHGLIFTWKGSDKGLKPLLLMAHQDVVPVPNATVEAWTHPPFSGHYDGHFVWGRGSSDCKNQLIAVMETMELLLDAGYEPKRSIVRTPPT